MRVAEHCFVSIQQELAGIEPVIEVDGPPTGAELTLFEAEGLVEAVRMLVAVVRTNSRLDPGPPPELVD